MRQAAYLLLLLMMPAVAIAGPDGGRIAGKVMPVITGIFGAIAGAAVFLPLMLRLGRQVRSAKQETKRFFEKYEKVASEQIKRDLKVVLTEWDLVLETLADILAKMRMKRMARELRDLL
jgi:hypothetical protein